jgi:hypothetical protein
MVSTPSTAAPSPAFHADDPEQTTDYRTLSVLAIISLVFGILSPLALWGPLLMGIPLLGIAISLLALRNIATSGGTLAGRGAAIAGLALCIASAVTPYSRDFIQRTIRGNQAAEAGQRWIALLTSGNTQEALRQTIDGSRPPRIAEPGAPPPTETPLERFMKEPVVKALTAIGANPEITLDETLEVNVASYRNVTVRQRYHVKSAAAAADVILTIQRGTLPGESMSRWLIGRYELADGKK